MKKRVPKAKSVGAAPSAELHPEKHKMNMMQARKLFASKGIKSKADAYHLINQGFAEHRFNEGDVRALQQAASLVFDDDSYSLAKTLINAKDRGLKVAAAKRNAAMKAQTPNKVENVPETPEMEAQETEQSPEEEQNEQHVGM